MSRNLSVNADSVRSILRMVRDGADPTGTDAAESMLARLRRDLAGTRSLFEFGRVTFPKYFTRPAAPFHESLAAQLDSLHTRRGSKIVRISPRESAKSTWGSLIYVIRCAMRRDERYILMTSQTSDQAEQLLASVREEVAYNPILAQTFPDACGEGPVWRNDRIVLRNGVTIQALGTGKKPRGRRRGADRPTLIIIDDPQSIDDITSERERTRAWEWLTRELIPAGSNTTNFLAVGTSLHEDAIVDRLMRTPGWTGKTVPAVIAWPTRMDLWGEWSRILSDFGNANAIEEAAKFFHERRSVMMEGAESFWPGYKPIDFLMARRAEIGERAFDSEYQGIVTAAEGAEWGDEVFSRGDFWFQDYPRELTVLTIALDPSKGADSNRKKRSDYSALVSLARAKDGTLYVEADLKRRTVERIVEDGIAFAERLQETTGKTLDGFGVEADQFQELLAVDFSRVTRERGIQLPLFKMSTGGTPKPVRIRRLSTHLTSGGIRFRRTAGTELLVRQLRQFPFGEHDDGPDALEYARRLAIHLVGRPKRG